MKVYWHWNEGQVQVKHHRTNQIHISRKSGNWNKPEWCMDGYSTGETVVEDEEGIKIRMKYTYPTRLQDGYHYW